MVKYKNREELILEICKRSKLFIQEFTCINEKDKDKLVHGVDRSPVQIIAYQLGWMNLILSWENQEQKGYTVVTPTPEYKWNNLGGLYESFYKYNIWFQNKKQLLIIGCVNIITQSILNILLNLINYKQGSMMFVFNYVWMEVFIFIIKARVYSVFLDKYSITKLTKKWRVPLYALTANIVSFGIGIYISYLIPGIF